MKSLETIENKSRMCHRYGKFPFQLKFLCASNLHMVKEVIQF